MHLTSVHGRKDIRIFMKECRSLAGAYRVTLIVADGKGSAESHGVQIIDAGRASGRLHRMRAVTSRIFEIAMQRDAQLYHLHDPELMPVGLKLKRNGKRVVFDAHEDLPKQLRSKPYLGGFLRAVLPPLLGRFEAWACSRFDAVVTATPSIRDKFKPINARSTDINNYPLLGELDSGPAIFVARNQVCYVGGIAAIRGIREVVNAMGRAQSGARLQLCGEFSEPQTRTAVQRLAGWKHVDELGLLDRGQVREMLARCSAGIVTFHAVPNHVDAQPNKMFEYMSAGIPVIGSHFPLWREIIEGNDCGRCVHPQDPAAIAEAVDFFVQNPAEARRMGENGRRAVSERYNWNVEERKLLALYDDLLRTPAA